MKEVHSYQTISLNQENDIIKKRKVYLSIKRGMELEKVAPYKIIDGQLALRMDWNDGNSFLIIPDEEFNQIKKEIKKYKKKHKDKKND